VALAPVVNGDDLTVYFPLEFKTGFAGAKGVYAGADDANGASSGWQSWGSWTAPAAPPPPPSGSFVTDNLQLHYDLTDHAAGAVTVGEQIPDLSGNGVTGTLADYVWPGGGWVAGEWTNLGLRAARVEMGTQSFGPTSLNANNSESFTMIWVGELSGEALISLYGLADSTGANVSAQ
jgi:hypothetical protein